MLAGDLFQILLVEDNSGDARLLQEMLQEAANACFELSHATRLGQALQHLDQACPDVVLLDLGLPDEQGLDTFLRAQAQAPHVPFVVLTGTDDNVLVQQLEGTIHLDRQAGTMFTITFPAHGRAGLNGERG